MRKDSFLLKGFFLDKLESVIQINYLKNNYKDVTLSDYYFILNNSFEIISQIIMIIFYPLQKCKLLYFEKCYKAIQILTKFF